MPEYTMSSYELNREENIRRNRALIMELGLGELSSSQDSGRVTKKKRKIGNNAATRASARIAAAPEQKYGSPSPLSLSDTESRPLKRKRIQSSSTVISDKQTRSSSILIEAELNSLVESWTRWKPTAALPQRTGDGTLCFESHPTFTPNKTPAEVLREGAFGGCYYRPYRSLKLGVVVRDDWTELPDDWTKGLDVSRFLTGGEDGEYDPEVNKYGVKAGQTIEDWERAGWINNSFDIRGWFQWYTRFYLGRRCEDDERQIGRWERCVGTKGRWRRVLLKQYLTRGVRTVNDEDGGEGGEEGEVSPVISQTVHHWGWEIRQDVLDNAWANGLH